MDFDFNSWARDAIASINFFLYDLTLAIYNLLH